MTDRKLRIGAAGMGRAFTLMLPTLAHDPRVALVAACDPKPEPRAQFVKDFGGSAYDGMEGLCADPEVEIVYIASPHGLHAEHAEMAAAKGKHLLIEKPLAASLEDCRRIIAAAADAKVQLIVGHSHSFDAPILRTRELICSGAYGRVRAIQALNFTDFLYRPRRPEELKTEEGGGVVFSQGAHQVEIVRLLAGGMARTVRAHTGIWDAARPAEGAYSALLSFADGVFASLNYNGYGHFDSDEFCGWIGESGRLKDRVHYGAARRALAQAENPEEEAALKAARNYGGAGYRPAAEEPALHPHFGFVLVSCERADLRPLPSGVMIYGDAEEHFEALPAPGVPRTEVIDELYGAIVHGRTPLHGGAWSLATMEVCLAILTSAREGREIALSHQAGADG